MSSQLRGGEEDLVEDAVEDAVEEHTGEIAVVLEGLTKEDVGAHWFQGDKSS